MTRLTTSHRFFIATICAASLVLGACGGSNDDAQVSTTDPVATDSSATPLDPDLLAKLTEATLASAVADAPGLKEVLDKSIAQCIVETRLDSTKLRDIAEVAFAGGQSGAKILEKIDNAETLTNKAAVATVFDCVTDAKLSKFFSAITGASASATPDQLACVENAVADNVKSDARESIINLMTGEAVGTGAFGTAFNKCLATDVETSTTLAS